MRVDGRQPDELRPVTMERGYAKFAEGSCFIKMGDTHMMVTATVEDRVPPFMKNTGKGWLTAEYSMLPRSGRERNQRPGTRGPNGRSMEIQRLIGRCLRTIVDLDSMGERTIIVDCDAIRADGGTRTASITAAYIAVHDALEWMRGKNMIKTNLLLDSIAAVSLGVVDGQEILDLCYEEDSRAQTDMNIVMTGSGKFVEIQGTAEAQPFTAEELGRMLSLAKKGIEELTAKQRSLLGA
ncbi:MAG TPA: ribonuclease PH [Fimbriimonadaceae bacterium]|nr:ribonuclease PH [Fimbriimonadaceae bacterium]